MPNVARYDDANTGGGIIKTIPQRTVFANDKLISVDGLMIEYLNKLNIPFIRMKANRIWTSYFIIKILSHALILSSNMLYFRL